RLRGKASRLGLPLSYAGDRDRLDTSRWPKHAPLSITHHVLQGLRTLDDVRFYDWRERVAMRPRPGDVLLGHPFARTLISPTGAPGPAEPEDLHTAFNRACLHGRFAARVALNPMHYGLPHYSQAIAPALDACDHILGIMGPYWFDTWGQGPFA